MDPTDSTFSVKMVRSSKQQRQVPSWYEVKMPTPGIVEEQRTAPMPSKEDVEGFPKAVVDRLRSLF